METLLLPDIPYHPGRHIAGARKGIQLSFALLEPVVFLQGHSTGSSACKDKAAVVRGYLHMKVTEPTKIKRTCIYFRGLVQLELPECAPLFHNEYLGNRDLITSGITYLDRGQTVQTGNAYGADVCHIPDQSGTDAERYQCAKKTVQTLWRVQSLPPEYNIGSLQQPRILGTVSKSTIFPVGDYLYSFEFLLHNSLPESINTDLISTRYYLEAIIEPSGPFSSKVVSQLDVPVIRLPAENSLELIEPIIFSRKWREQLAYDVCIFGKCFPLGSQIPIRHVQHRTKGKKRRFLQLPTKKVLLFEKQAGLASYSSYPGSTLRIMTDEGRARTPDIQTTNLLGEESEISDIKLEVQLPRCPEMKIKEKTQRLHFSTKGGSPEIVLCLSTADQDGMGSSKARPVELTIEAPFTILSCRATPANIYVPPYQVEGATEVTASQEGQCGCGQSPRSISLASRHEAEEPKAAARDNLMSVKGQFPGDITQPVSFDISHESANCAARILRTVQEGKGMQEAVRCKREGDSCSRCKQREQKCEFSPSSRKRIVKGQPKAHRDTIDEMKNRLERMESLLLARRRSSVDNNSASSSLGEGKEDDASYCLMDRIGFSSFIGSASGLALLSPRGLQWVSSITHSTDLLDFFLTRARTYMLGWSEEMMSTWQHLRPDDQTPLPPKGSAILAVNYFFAYVNSTLPLFDQKRFMERFNSQYSDDPPTSVAWYASLNAVLGIGALVLEDEIGVSSTVLHPRQNIEGGGHVLSCLRNCYSVFTQLSYSCREVMGVQALIGMAMVLEILLDVEAGYMAIGSAGRLALGLGLNRDCDSESSPGEVEERRNVFWVLYVLDRGLSFRLGRPPTIRDEDIQISEPTDGKFAHLVRLIRIESEIYTRLYSVRAREPDRRSERLAAEDELYQKLLAWQYSLPYEDLRPGQVLHCPNPEQLPSIITLHAEFYNCQLMLWRLEIGAETSSSPEDPRWSSKRRACLAAARDTVKLLDSLQEGGELFRNNLARRLSYYPLCAFVRLFINVLLNPHDPSAFADLDSLRVVLNTMSGPLLTSSSPFALFLFEIFQELTRTAEDFLVRTLSGEANETGHEVPSTMDSSFGIPSDSHTLGGWCPQLPPPFSDYAVLSYEGSAPTREQEPLAKVDQIFSHSGIGASDTLFPGYEPFSSEVQVVDSGLSSPSLHRDWQNPAPLPDSSSSLGPPS
ncbi:hypothetical protein CNMCM5623_001923 [Aspergillus felis]|uniref:Xylanolytic transcriptional activator regulatory domain-containing protein n=1 Tax=Aspergillus felis TaxID=1287682 RepID=A0A8H6V052_9EURO|nr:hypothetical protein CNMCM5623_001923 [Aspergillus felis]